MTPEPDPAGAGWDASRLPPGTDPRPVVAVMVPRWESRTEEGWITRQVAGALACVAEVHVITPQGVAPRRRVDSVFTVHETATPLERVAELRRDILIEAVSQSGGVRDGRIAPEFGPLLDGDLVEPWRAATDVLATLRPDAVVIAGHQHLGALDAVDAVLPGVPLTLIALGSGQVSLAFPHFDRLFDRAESVLAVTDTERSEIVGQHGSAGRVHRIGAPLAANSSALSEPNPWVGDTEYVLVITDADSRQAVETVELSRLIRMRFPENPVGISYTDTFVAWHEGRANLGWPVERSSDLGRLMAWARVVVDLRPGPLFARRCVDSLLYGTPIIVPEDSRAREHAQLGGGGLWFSTPGELTWCIEEVLRPDTREALSRQGRAYAEEHYGSTDRFVDRVVRATGVATAPALVGGAKTGTA